jgi:hypothetical protein
MVKLYLHSPIRFYCIVLNELNTGTTSHLPFNLAVKCQRITWLTNSMEQNSTLEANGCLGC